MLRLHSRAKIITFIGPVGVGKSTQMRLIQNRFRSCGVRTITTYLKSSHALAYILTKLLKGIGAYEEVALDDGDINMFEVIKALHETGYDGPIGPDHAPEFNDDEFERRIGRAYSVGYIKALLRVLEN